MRDHSYRHHFLYSNQRNISLTTTVKHVRISERFFDEKKNAFHWLKLAIRILNIVYADPIYISYNQNVICFTSFSERTLFVIRLCIEQNKLCIYEEHSMENI